MAGLDFERLLQKAREGRKPADSPSVAIPRQVSVETPALHAMTPPATSKRDRSKGKEVMDDLPPKKHKSAKDKDPSRKTHSHLDLEHPTESDFERFKADPLLFAADIARAGARLLAKMKQMEEERTAGMRLYAINLWLEGDNLDKTEKLNRAYEYISELRQQLETEKQKVKDAQAALQPTADALAEARTSLKSVEKERDMAVTKLSQAEEDLKLEQERSSKLDKELGSTRERADYAETQLHKVDDELYEVVQSTVTLCTERFQEAIRQVRYVYPTYEINEEIIKSDHTLKDGRIIIPERRNSDNQIISPEVVIYERPA